MTQKFVMGAPIYRQEQELNRRGISLSRQTMSNWILRAAEDYLRPVYEQLHRELLTRDVLHADETTLQDMDRVIDPVCRLCRDHERSGFVNGVKVAICLERELAEK